MKALLQAREIAKSFGSSSVFSGVSFEIQAGQHLAVLGPSGCGKTTLLRLLAGLDPPTAGQLFIDGQLVSEPGRVVVLPHRRKLAMVFQDLALWPTLRAVENVILGLAQSPLNRSEKREQALNALSACRVGGLADRKPATLSIGQQQRVALARAVALRPRLLLLDEPFSSLDPLVKAELIGEIHALARRFGITLMLVTHDPWEAQAVCERALVIEDGGVKEHDELRALLAAPRSAFLRAFGATAPAGLPGGADGQPPPRPGRPS
jgi:ABC-type Fe3+/spermidine/putrescine transport system ATPase subunit